MLRSRSLLSALEVLLLCSCGLSASVVPGGTNIEIRLLTPIGSRVSHSGDEVKAVIIAPVAAAHELLELRGAVLLGTVEEVQPLGLGLKRGAAELQLWFQRIQFPDGAEVSIGARVREIETAREHVGGNGTVMGIDPAANVSSGLLFLMSTGLSHGGLEASTLVFKLLMARSPDSEIYFPAGTELIAELAHDIVLDSPNASSARIPALSENEIAVVQDMLSGLPLQQAELLSHHSSDLTNILLLGTKEQVEAAFRAAGWSGESRRSIWAMYRMYRSFVERMGYSLAPMSKMTLNGRPQSKTYQKSLDTVTKRHHVRFWEQEDMNAWLGAASEDIGLTIRRMHLTHTIEEDIDDERAKVINDLWFAGCVDEGSLLSREKLKQVLEDGIPIVTDGDLAVLRLRDCSDSGLQKAGPGARHASWARAWSIVRNEVIRSNPVTIAFNTVRSAGTIMRPKIPASGVVATTTHRPSIVDKHADELAAPTEARATASLTEVASEAENSASSHALPPGATLRLTPFWVLPAP